MSAQAKALQLDYDANLVFAIQSLTRKKIFVQGLQSL